VVAPNRDTPDPDSSFSTPNPGTFRSLFIFLSAFSLLAFSLLNFDKTLLIETGFSGLNPFFER